MEFFRGKRERSALNPGGADIKWNSPYLIFIIIFCPKCEWFDGVEIPLFGCLNCKAMLFCYLSGQHTPK